MNRLDYLREEYESVDRTLRETLRHDYGPERSRSYYDECRTRLAAVRMAGGNADGLSAVQIADRLKTLGSIASRVALIERSHLGEFSWPFAEEIRRIAELAFQTEQADGTHPPIVHVIAEGIGYQIKDDDVETMGNRRILVVMFPRQLKHHVLLHSIFGHELGHPAIRGDTATSIYADVMPHLARGPLQDRVQLTAWAKRKDAPAAVTRMGEEAIEKAIKADTPDNWRTEMFCDLFGLMLFGPAFAAAHRTILEPLSAGTEVYDLGGVTHPPYPLRQRFIADAMRLLGWDEPIMPATCKEAYEGERSFLEYAAPPAGPDWERLVDEDALKLAIDGLRRTLDRLPGISFERPDADRLGRMIARLAICRPPIVEKVDPQGRPQNERVSVPQCLYAGWAFWFGRSASQEKAFAAAGRDDLPRLNFLQVNRLCEQAILQQRAIDAVLAAQAPSKEEEAK